MADIMEFPKTMKEFVDSYSFKDREEVYTNGVELIPVFRVEQAIEHYEKEIRNKAIDDFAKKMFDVAYEDYESDKLIIDYVDVVEIAEEMRCAE